MSEKTKSYSPMSCQLLVWAGLLFILMVFIAAEKGFCLWNEVQQDQIELSENADPDADKEDNSEEDSDDFVHFMASLNQLTNRGAMALCFESFRKAQCRSDVFTPPPEA
jgi:hypothetical protein